MSKQAKHVLYFRVSTDEQGRSGLGLEAQRAACREFVQARGGKVIAEFEEVASAYDDGRPEVAKALRRARRAGAILVTAKVDRLSRSVAFCAHVKQHGPEWLVADMPDAESFQVHLYAAFGELERKRISERTKAALGALKARGVKLGSARPGHWDGREQRREEGQARATKRAAAARHAANADLYAEALPIIERTAGDSLRAAAAALEQAGILTARGSETWTPTAVKRLRARLLSAS